MVSIEGTVTTTAPVTLFTVRACVSLVPETAEATYPNVAPTALLLTTKAGVVLLMLATVGRKVEPSNVIVV